MANLDPNVIANTWAERLGGSTAKITRGIQAVTESPTEAAARNVDRQVMGVQQAAASGKTAAALRRVTLADWQNAAIKKGVSRIGQGAIEAKPKMAAFMAQFLPHLQAGLQAVRQMPKTTLDDRLNRMVAMARHNAQFKMQG